MVYIKQLSNSECALIVDKVVYLFDRFGTCTQEEIGVLPKYLDHMMRVNTISILSSNEITEIGIDSLEGFKNYKVNVNSLILLEKLNKERKFSRILNRRGKFDNIRYNQTIFVYSEGINVYELLKNLGVVLEDVE